MIMFHVTMSFLFLGIANALPIVRNGQPAQRILSTNHLQDPKVCVHSSGKLTIQLEIKGVIHLGQSLFVKRIPP